MNENNGDNMPLPNKPDNAKSSFSIGTEHKNPLLFLQQIIISVFVRTGKPIKDITVDDVTPEDIDNAPKM